ncbi:hypothetical protein PC120_g24561 [Phytophthora cactorum]|nr:hypothetical protein PC120_g24561 [Phytophthora cactorum]
MVVSTQVLQATGNTIHRNLLGLYHGIYGGAAGFTYGCNSVWLMYDADPVPAKPLQNLSTDVLETLKPAHTLLSSPSNHTGKSVNAYEGTRYDSFPLQLGGGSGGSSGTVRWFSPRDGHYSAEATVNVPASCGVAICT